MDGITDGVMAAMIAAGAALLTVIITVGGAAWVAVRQLAHDRLERATDRALQSKRERLFISLTAATDVTRSIGRLARPGSEISASADRFTEAVNNLAAGASVASLEVVERGRDLAGQAGRLFLIAMAKRAGLASDASVEEWADFGNWTIDAQVELQIPYGLLLAAVRRDLGISDSSDEQVLAATKVDVAALEHAAAEAKSILLDK